MINRERYRKEKGTKEEKHEGKKIKREKDYMFNEKRNKKIPFQVSIFKNKKAVKRYLDYRMNTSFLFDATIMENDELFQP